MTMLNELDKEISVEPSQARKTLLDKIDKLFFYKVPQEAWFLDDYVYYKDGNFFEKGHRFEMITSSSTGVKYSVLCNMLQVKITDDFIQDTFEAMLTDSSKLINLYGIARLSDNRADYILCLSE